MTDQPQTQRRGSLFTGLDKALLRETAREQRPQEEEAAAAPKARIPEGQKASNLERQEDRAERQPAERRAGYPKGTYRLHPDAIDALDDSRRRLNRHHNLKASREQIVEALLLAAHEDLVEREGQSFLVSQLSKIPESQKAGNLEKEKKTKRGT